MENFYFGGVVIIVTYLLLPYLPYWSLNLRRYMLTQSNRVFGHSFGWDRPFGLLLCKALIILFTIVFLVFVYDSFFRTQ